MYKPCTHYIYIPVLDVRIPFNIKVDRSIYFLEFPDVQMCDIVADYESVGFFRISSNVLRLGDSKYTSILSIIPEEGFEKRDRITIFPFPERFDKIQEKFQKDLIKLMEFLEKIDFGINIFLTEGKVKKEVYAYGFGASKYGNVDPVKTQFLVTMMCDITMEYARVYTQGIRQYDLVGKDNLNAYVSNITPTFFVQFITYINTRTYYYDIIEDMISYMKHAKEFQMDSVSANYFEIDHWIYYLQRELDTRYE